jgi:alpha-D-xyloside xylohydrolase
MLLPSVIAFGAFAVQNPADLTTTPSGLALKCSKGVVRIQICTPKIVHVTFNADEKFVPARVPIVVAQFSTCPFHVEKRADDYLVTTSELRLSIDAKTGMVRSTTSVGKPLLKEAGDGPQLQSKTIGAEQVLSAQDQFDLGEDESIYGLGQHQDGSMNYRGSYVDMSQHNMNVAVPLLLSSHGYGLLWNNASRGSVDAGGAISPDLLTDDAGMPGALTGSYYKGQNFDTLVESKRDSSIDFNWTTKAPSTLPLTDYSVRWTGTITAPIAGDYRLQTVSDDGVRLFIDDSAVIDDWAVHAAKPDSAVIHFDANTKHKIRLEYFQNTRDAIIRLGWSAPGASTFTWKSEAADRVDYYLIYGPSLDQVIKGYRTLTGPAPMPPKWALGYWQSKERYKTQQEWQEIADGYRSRHLPIDNLVQDWFYWDPAPWGSHKFDPARYPDPAAGIKQLHDLDHLHLMISVWGKFSPGTTDNPDANYDALNAAKELYPTSVSKPEQYYDAFDPAARKLYWSQIDDQLFKKGIDAWWLDASEPEVDLDALAVVPTAAGLGARVMSAWPLMHTQGVYEGQRAEDPSKRVFILTRSAFAGQQRNAAATWSGDISASWDTLARQIPAGLNFSMSGIPYWTTDIGAFFVNYPGGNQNPDYQELYTRWFEYGAFCPIFRSHGTSTPREMWQFGKPVEDILRKYDELRYRLMPYIYSEASRVSSQGGTLMRGLAMDFGYDPKVANISDEYMFGPSLLICPVTKAAAKSRSVYLPAGPIWINFWTGRSFEGGKTLDVDCPLDTMPIFVKGGSVIPLGPKMEYTSEKPSDPIELRVYPGPRTRFDLYEDAGDGYGYEKGESATIPIAVDYSRDRVWFGKRAGSFPGMLQSRTFNVVLVQPGLGVGLDEPVKSRYVVPYSGDVFWKQF